MARRYGYRPWLDESERYEAPFKIADLGKAPSTEPPWIPTDEELEDMKTAGNHGIFVPAEYKEKLILDIRSRVEIPKFYDPMVYYDFMTGVPETEVSHQDYGAHNKDAMLIAAGLPRGPAVEGDTRYPGWIKCGDERLNELLHPQDLGGGRAKPLQSAWTERAAIALQQNGRRSAVPAAFARAVSNMCNLKNATLVN